MLKRITLLTASIILSSLFIAAQPTMTPANTFRIDEGDSKELIIAKAAHVIPTVNQLEALGNEFIAFVHFGPNTFTRLEWGSGTEDPAVFDLKDLDTDQWCQAMKAAGMKMVILTVKHHDGFVLWQSRYTHHGIMSTNYRNGKGDVLGELSASCRKYGLKLGVYLSPADLYQIEHADGLYGNLSSYRQRTIPRQVPGRPFSNKTTFTFEVDDYNEYFLNQLFEILTEYGEIHEVWFDGAHPKRKGGQTYNYSAWKKLIRTLAPKAVIFGREDIRWCGNEAGATRKTEWNVISYPDDPDTTSHFPDRTEYDLGSRETLYRGRYLHYQQAETNTSIREGWFYRDDTHQKVRSADDVFDIYERSVGGNSTFLLNIPPNREGKFSEADVAVLEETGKRIRETYEVNLLQGAEGPAALLDGNPDTYILLKEAHREMVIQLPAPAKINRVMLQEAIASHSERVEAHAVDAWIGNRWVEIAAGTNIGYKRILRFPEVTTQKLRIRVTAARLDPTISHLSAHYYQTRPPQLTFTRDKEGMVTIEPREGDFNWNPHGENAAGNLNAGYEVYYTLDGSEPTQHAIRYTQPVKVVNKLLKAVSYQNNQLGTQHQEAFGIAKKKWQLVGVSSQQQRHAATMAFDGDRRTYWQSEKSRGPHHITIDLGEVHHLSTMVYTPQTLHAEGMMAKGMLQVSADSKKWETVETFLFGNLVNDPTPRTHRFSRPVTTRYIRVVASEIAGDGNSLSMAELDFASPPTEERVADLLSRMTIEEKIGQLCCPTGWEMYHKTGDHTVAPSALFRERMQHMPPGSLWATLRADPWTEKTLQTGLNPELAAKALNALQKYAIEETRLGIPLFFAEECPHGHMAIGTTVYPTSLAQAGTFNRELIREMAAAIGLEASLQGAHIGYGPILDVAREPRWSRMEETFGEDPLLTGILGSHFVQGLQGDDSHHTHRLYSTLKHFAAYGIPSGGHNGQKASIGMRELFSDHLEPFRRAIGAGAMSIMTSYNAVDGEPTTASSFLLKELLRERWGFQGFVFSDLGSIEGIAGTHRVAPDVKHAAAMALQAGVDIDLGGNAYGRNLAQALADNLISMADIDLAVSNVLRLKFEMGLFENPYVDPLKAATIVRSDAHKQIARKVARQGTVLLKNENGLLPLSREISSIAVIGPNADNIYNQLGDYTAPQERHHIVTLLDGIRNAAAPHTLVRYAKGCAIRDTTQTNIEEAVALARASDVVVLVVGGSSARDFKTEYLETGAATVAHRGEEILSDMDSGEGYDRSTLHLLGDQEKLLNGLAATGKPLIVIYIQGRPLNMNNAAQKADALLTAWYPGEEGGNGIADILFGDYNPAGRLPVTVPRSVGQLPVYYSLGRQAEYIDGSSTPLYAFGYGLSYTHFQYSDLTIHVEKEQVEVTCTITNDGKRDGDEVVQLYLRDNQSSVVTPPLQLKDFQRIHIQKGASTTVTFTLKYDDLALYNRQMQRVTEPGAFTVMIGAASDDIRLRDTFLIE